jgi:hypothetical protein
MDSVDVDRIVRNDFSPVVAPISVTREFVFEACQLTPVRIAYTCKLERDASAVIVD